MTAIGGSIESITINRREFAVAADADVTRGLGGTDNTILMNGNGTGRLGKARMGWVLEGLQISTDDSREDHEFLQESADEKGFFPVMVTMASGIVYSGTGQLTDTKNASSQNAVTAVSLGGPGRLRPQ